MRQIQILIVFSVVELCGPEDFSIIFEPRLSRH